MSLPCKMFSGTKDKQGYGRIRRQGKLWLAHRYIYWLTQFDGDPEFWSLDVCHTCDNPSCVEPSHLWLGTARQNIIDSVRKGRYKLHRWKRLSPEDVKNIRESSLTNIEISRQYHIDDSTVSKIRRGITRN